MLNTSIIKTHIVLLIVFILCVKSTFAQTCPQRYKNYIFQNISISSDILYGNNIKYDSINQSLLLDFYEPLGDTLSHRPLIIFIHGGGYVGGTKLDPKITTLCKKFAQKGYVTASIEYRVGIDTSNGNNFFNALVRAVHDAKAAIRFFRMHADSLGVDTGNIFIGGCSAGGVTALHTAYMDSSELYSHAKYDSSLIGLDGGIEGNSGSPGFSSDVNGVLNLWGAITDTSWININNAPVISIFGAADNVVPPHAGTHPSYNDISLHGGIVVHQHASQIGLISYIKSYVGVGHGHSAGSPHMDTSIYLITNFLCDLLNPIITNKDHTNKHVPAFEILLIKNNTIQSIKVPYKIIGKTLTELYELDGRCIERKYISGNMLYIKSGSSLPNVAILRITNNAFQVSKLISID